MTSLHPSFMTVFAPKQRLVSLIVLIGLLFHQSCYCQNSNSTPRVITLENFGPFFDIESSPEYLSWGLHPVISYSHDTTNDIRQTDFLYPIFSERKFGSEYRLQFCQLFSLSGGRLQNDSSKSSFTIFPLFFCQRASDTNLNYTAFVPFYGKIMNKFHRDEIQFTMFPLYLKSRKADVLTENYLFPLVHFRKGERLHGFQFWPIYGKETCSSSTITNTYGDLEILPGHEKFFLFWPFYIQQKSGIGTTNPQTSFAMIPFYAKEQSRTRHYTSILWPFFSNITDNDRGYHEFQGPWPFIIYAHGYGKNAFRIWPIFGFAKNKEIESHFLLWPLYKKKNNKTEDYERNRQQVCLFLYSDITEKMPKSGLSKQRTDLWPLFSMRKTSDGQLSFRSLAILEPILKGTTAIERNYSPLYTLWFEDINKKTGDSTISVLFSLYKEKQSLHNTYRSFLFGLLSYEKNTSYKKFKIFWLPVWKKATTDNQ